MALAKLDTITIPRGDTFEINITTSGTTAIEVGDKLSFAIKRQPLDSAEELILKENIDGGTTFTFSLTSEDTDIAQGTYFYQFRLFKQDGQVITLCEPSGFIIKGVIVDV
jgi:acetylornithine/succinyldiaminopimelate/putrescine aminotransferase